MRKYGSPVLLYLSFVVIEVTKVTPYLPLRSDKSGRYQNPLSSPICGHRRVLRNHIKSRENKQD